MTPIEALNARLAELRPRSLLYLSARPALSLDAATAGGEGLALTVRNDVATVADLEHEARYDCVLVADFLEHLPKAQGLGVLGRLRNLHAGRVLVFIDHDMTAGPWTMDDFLGLGFRLDATLADAARALSFYSYDIATYNHERDWNNPRFWANPEMWGKYFW